MEQQQKWELYLKICERAEKLNVERGGRFTAMMDVELADKKWELRLQEWLETDDFSFVHDFVGIQNNINRVNKTFSPMWVPRFASF